MRSCVTISINGRFLTQPITGVQRYAREVLGRLDEVVKERPDLDICLLTPPRGADVPRLRNITHKVVGHLSGHAWEQLELPFYAKGILFCPGNTAPLLSFIRGGRVVVCVHDLSYLYFPSAYSRAFRALYRVLIPAVLTLADAVITVSESERKAIVEHYPRVSQRLVAVQNGGIGRDRAVDLVDAQLHDNYVLYVGSLSRRKNFPNMLSAALTLAEKRAVRFVFIGGTPEGILASERLVPPHLAEKIVFLGQIDDVEALISYYKKARCLMFPSFYEASPLPPIEAMACGCAVIASAIPSMMERCGDAAIYCDPYSIDSIVDAIETTLDDDHLLATLRARGLQRAKSFTWKRCVDRTLDIIEGRA